jgi:uncharacterized protein YaaQ
MKLIICILQDTDKDNVVNGLVDGGYRVTSLPSTGAYFRRGNTTLLIGVEDEKVKPAIKVVKENCAEPEDPGIKRATLFVLNIDRFEQV